MGSWPKWVGMMAASGKYAGCVEERPRVFVRKLFPAGTKDFSRLNQTSYKLGSHPHSGAIVDGCLLCHAKFFPPSEEIDAFPQDSCLLSIGSDSSCFPAQDMAASNLLLESCHDTKPGLGYEEVNTFVKRRWRGREFMRFSCKRFLHPAVLGSIIA